jgi:hypothetical protein
MVVLRLSANRNLKQNNHPCSKKERKEFFLTQLRQAGDSVQASP